MRITVIKESIQTTFHVSPAGWFSGDIADGFTFGMSASKSKNDVVIQILKLINAGAEKIEIIVVDGLDPTKTITITFPLTTEKHLFQKWIKDIQ